MLKKPIVRATADGIDRVESGPVQFGKDWPGLFLRGDHALKVAASIRRVQSQLGESAIAEDWAFKFLLELAVTIEIDVAK